MQYSNPFYRPRQHKNMSTFTIAAKHHSPHPTSKSPSLTFHMPQSLNGLIIDNNPIRFNGEKKTETSLYAFLNLSVPQVFVKDFKMYGAGMCGSIVSKELNAFIQEKSLHNWHLSLNIKVNHRSISNNRVQQAIKKFTSSTGDVDFGKAVCIGHKPAGGYTQLGHSILCIINTGNWAKKELTIESATIESSNEKEIGIPDKYVLHMHESQDKETDDYPKQLFMSPQKMLTDATFNHDIKGNLELLVSFSEFVDKNLGIKSGSNDLCDHIKNDLEIFTLLNDDDTDMEVPTLEVLNIALNDIIQSVTGPNYTNESVDKLIWVIIKWLDMLVEKNSHNDDDWEAIVFVKDYMTQIKGNMSEFNTFDIQESLIHRNVAFNHCKSLLQNNLKDKDSLSTHHIIVILIQDIFGNFVSLFDGQHQVMACHRLFNKSTIINSSACSGYMLWRSPFDTTTNDSSIEASIAKRTFSVSRLIVNLSEYSLCESPDAKMLYFRKISINTQADSNKHHHSYQTLSFLQDFMRDLIKNKQHLLPNHIKLLLKGELIDYTSDSREPTIDSDHIFACRDDDYYYEHYYNPCLGLNAWRNFNKSLLCLKYIKNIHNFLNTQCEKIPEGFMKDGLLPDNIDKIQQIKNSLKSLSHNKTCMFFLQDLNNSRLVNHMTHKNVKDTRNKDPPHHFYEYSSIEWKQRKLNEESIVKHYEEFAIKYGFLVDDDSSKAKLASGDEIRKFTTLSLGLKAPIITTMLLMQSMLESTSANNHEKFLQILTKYYSSSSRSGGIEIERDTFNVLFLIFPMLKQKLANRVEGINFKNHKSRFRRKTDDDYLFIELTLSDCYIVMLRHMFEQHTLDKTHTIEEDDDARFSWLFHHSNFNQFINNEVGEIVHKENSLMSSFSETPLPVKELVISFLLDRSPANYYLKNTPLYIALAFKQFKIITKNGNTLIKMAYKFLTKKRFLFGQRSYLITC